MEHIVLTPQYTKFSPDNNFIGSRIKIVYYFHDFYYF